VFSNFFRFDIIPRKFYIVKLAEEKDIRYLKWPKKIILKNQKMNLNKKEKHEKRLIGTILLAL